MTDEKLTLKTRAMLGESMVGTKALRLLDERERRIEQIDKMYGDCANKLVEARAALAARDQRVAELEGELAQREYANPFAEARGVDTAPTAQDWEQACRNVNKLLGETELARKAAESEVTRLREALDAAEERHTDQERRMNLRAEAAEARVRELEADVSKFVVRATTAERQLAAANALLREMREHIPHNPHRRRLWTSPLTPAAPPDATVNNWAGGVEAKGWLSDLGWAELARREATPTDPTPIPMVLHCPECRTRHIDEGAFATKVHHTHSCQGCGLTWRPAVVPTVGVQFLPGFRNVAPTDYERAVLEAADGAVIEWVQAGTRTPRLSDGSSQTMAEAVLKRREAKKNA